MRRISKMDLQFFADGSGGTDAQGSGTQAAGGRSGAGYTYEQLNEVANSRAEAAGKAALEDFFKKQGMSEEGIAAAISDYKAKQKASQPDVAALESARDQALKEVGQLKNEKLLASLKVRSDDVDYVMYKVGQMVTDKKDFKTAAEEFLKANPRYKEGGAYRMTGGVASAGGSPEGAAAGNEAINSMIRSAFGRK